MTQGRMPISLLIKQIEIWTQIQKENTENQNKKNVCTTNHQRHDGIGQN